jgi:hypothetical protein
MLTGCGVFCAQAEDDFLQIRLRSDGGLWVLETDTDLTEQTPPQRIFALETYGKGLLHRMSEALGETRDAGKEPHLAGTSVTPRVAGQTMTMQINWSTTIVRELKAKVIAHISIYGNNH